MINLFVTYRCNLACPYCFARSMAAHHPRDLSPEGFASLLAWMEDTRLPAVAFLGGEPTLHPRLSEMVEKTARTGAAVVLFTNGLFAPELADGLVPFVSNFVINANDPSLYTPTQGRTFRAVLDRLDALGARLTFSKNFSPSHSGTDALFEAIDRWSPAAVRYDISRPDANRANDHCSPAQARDMAARVAGFVRACQARGVRTGLDCAVRRCDFASDDLAYLERVSMKFRGICHPSVDVHPDLSASYCLPLGDVRVDDVTAFSGEEALIRHFAQAVRPLRQMPPSPECAACTDFGRRCQGGCLALNRSPAGLPPPGNATPGSPRP